MKAYSLYRSTVYLSNPVWGLRVLYWGRIRPVDKILWVHV